MFYICALLLLRRNREHRAGSDVEQPLRDAPEEELLERPTPARSDDDEVRPRLLGAVSRDVRGISRR